MVINHSNEMNGSSINDLNDSSWAGNSNNLSLQNNLVAHSVQNSILINELVDTKELSQ
jgi:hypothetical protein